MNLILKFLLKGSEDLSKLLNNRVASFGQKTCPRCDQHEIKTVKAKSWMTSAIRGRYFQELFNRSRDLYVCKDCGFSWEDR